MKCRYRFRVQGRLKLSVNVPVSCRGWTFKLEAVGGLITHVVVIVPLPRREDWPLIQRDPAPGVAAHIQPKTPHLPFIQRELRSLQGLLARSIIAADSATDIEIPLTFFRRGMLDLYNHDYIEAIYDFYFVLETLFADGKFKTAAVLKAFRNSNQLCSSVKRALTDPGPILTGNKRSHEDFKRKYGRISVDQALEGIVEVRGHLHHHTSKRRDTWHPDDQRHFECDALFLQTVTYNIVFELAEPYLYAEEVINAYEDLVQRHREHRSRQSDGEAR